MDSDTPLDAAARCLNTIELLEGILRYVDTKTLLLSQRTSRTFEAVIEDSRPLQQRLFRAPASASEVLEADFIPNQSERPSILVHKDMSAAEALVNARWNSGPVHEYLDPDDSNYTQLCTLNPLLLQVPKWHLRAGWPAQFWLDSLSKRVPESVWRRMYIMQPMPTLLRVRAKTVGRYPEGQYSLRGRDQRGRPLMLGEIMDELTREKTGDLVWVWKDKLWRAVQVSGKRVEEVCVSFAGRDRGAKRLAKKQRRKEEMERKAEGSRVEDAEGVVEATVHLRTVMLDDREDH